MVKEISKINKPSQLKKIISEKGSKEQKEQNVSNAIIDSDVTPEFDLLLEKDDVLIDDNKKEASESNLDSVNIKIKNFFEQKITGAISQFFKRKELDVSVEKSLSNGLELNEQFVAANNKIDKKRGWLITRFSNLLKQKQKDNISNTVESDSYIFDEAAAQAMKELEAELTDELTKEFYNKLADGNKRIILDHLVDNPVGNEVKIIDLPTVSDANDNVIAFSDNGYLVQLTNKNEVREVEGINLKSDKALYNLIAPNGVVLVSGMNYETVLNGLEELSGAYHQSVKKEFLQSPDDMVETVATESEAENKESIEKELEPREANNDEVTFVFVDNEIPNEALNEKVSKYAESIGIKSEQLATNQEFLSLSPEQQQFALETLRRTSLTKAKVEAHESFAKEKASKKWWQIGFAINQNFHKERHKIEAIKNIERQGLEGYGEAEFAWLTNVIKNGPEVKINDKGHVIVNCLSDNNFSNKELIAKYNEEARKYIEGVVKDDRDYDEIKDKLIANCSDEERLELFYKLNESEKNIKLLKFLSANKETEMVIQKMADRSLTGLDKAKMMAGSQKDKAGYSALGFALRTGSKFVLANSAYVASALTYSTAPIVAAMVGGFRGYNQGKKSLMENQELAQLGIEDKSKTAKDLNLAVGENSLKEKLDNLVDKFQRLKIEGGSDEEFEKTKKSLEARIYYTQKKMNKELVSYGLPAERGANYLELTNSLVRANSVFYYNTNLLRRYWDEDYVSDGVTKLTRRNKTAISIDLFNKKPDASDSDYKEWAKDKKRFEELQKVSVEDRLTSFLNYKEDEQHRKELKFLIKKTATGALMGASFAAVGAFVAEHLNITSWLNHKTDGDGVVSKSGTKFTSSLSSKEQSFRDVDTSSSKINSDGEVAFESNLKSEQVIDQPKSQPNSAHNHEQLSAHRDKIKLEKIEAKPFKVEVGQSEDISQIHTPDNQVNVSESITEPGINDATAEAGSPKIEEPYQEDQVLPKINSDKMVEKPSSAIISQEAIDGKNVAMAVKETIDVGNKAAKLTDDLYSNKIRSNVEFLEKISEANSNVQLSPEQELEAKNIYESFKQNNDYNILRKRLISFEDKLITQKVVEVPAVNDNIGTTEVPVNDVVDSSVSADVSDIRAANTSAIAKELDVKPESLNQVGENLVYRGKDNSSLIFDLKHGGIKEVTDASGKKIPNEFVKDLIGDKKISKFTRGGGLDKIFSNWTKLSSNDKLTYESLSWFNNGKLAPADLLSQIKGLYQVNTENVYIDSDNKQFITGNGKKFAVTLKGIKTLIATLPKK